MALVLGGIAAALLLAVFIRGIDHDEGQYLAATLLARTMLPYRDFDYLQTPLQPLLFAPLLSVWPARALILLRLLNAGAIAAAIALLYRAMRGAGADATRSLMLCALLACSEPLLFGAAMARNDALPCLFLSGALLAMAGGGAERAIRPRRAASIGVLLAAAAATKLSYALPCLSVVAVELIARRRGYGRLPVRWLALGALPVILLVGVVAASTPWRFWFDVVLFPVHAPAEWYSEIGQGRKLELSRRLLAFFAFLAKGPAPVLLAILAIAAWRFRIADRGRWLARQLDGLILAGAVAALLPMPEWRQYLVPLLPPLFVRLAMVPAAAWPERAWWRAALALFAVAGLSPTVRSLSRLFHHGSPVLRVERDADALGVRLRGLGVVGPVATVTPERFAGSGLEIDPRFAAGPFLLRTRDGLGQSARIVGVTRASLDARLDAAPPGAIVTRAEPDARAAMLDGLLERWGSRNGFVLVGHGPGGMRIAMPGDRVRIIASR